MTSAALHRALLRLSAPHELDDDVATAPVVEEVRVEVPVPVPVPVEKAVVPIAAEKEVRQKTNWLTTILGGGGFLGGVGSWLAGVDTEKLLIISGLGLGTGVLVLVFGEIIVRRMRGIRKAVEE